MTDLFPRRWATTRGFTLGQPRNIQVSPDGQRVLFLRSDHGEDPVNRLWELDVATGEERLIADPTELAVDDEELPLEERRRRERLRESGGGITAYAGDRSLRVLSFALGGRLYVVRSGDGQGPRGLEAPEGVFDPRPDPTGSSVAYVAGEVLHVVDVDGGERLAVSEPDVSWGLAEFVAAEEMGRTRGYWWAPEGQRLLAARVDESSVRRWHIADPVDPSREPIEVRYPVAGSDNADVSLWVVDLLGDRTAVEWDRGAFPYLARVRWREGHPPLILVQSRDQQTTQALAVDPGDGSVSVLREDRDGAWVDLVPGAPDLLGDGRLVSTVDAEDTRRLAIDGEPVTPAGLQVSAILHVDDDHVLFQGSTEPTEAHVWRWAPGDLARLTSDAGRHHATADGGTLVIRRTTLASRGTRITVHRDGQQQDVVSRAADPGFEPRPEMLRLGERELRAALFLPDGDGPHPVVLWPYGGPGAQRVVAASAAHLRTRWLADQGFAVLVIDGRGTPGRGPGWERSIHLDVDQPVLDDQIDGLHAAADRYPELDLQRVGIMGWSFGGWLAALAVLRRPDVFHAAVAGAPVTEWRLYDTHYTERYLGHPDRHVDAYDRASLLPDAAQLARPLLVIHGMTDDNVVVAHTLRLSRALLEAGRAHTVLPLSGVTHMTPQAVVAENLLRLQVGFLREHLGRGATSSGGPRSG